MKALVVCMPAISHARSIAGVARRLEERGHDVAWASNRRIGYVETSRTKVHEVLASRAMRENEITFPDDLELDLEGWMLEHWFLPATRAALEPTIELVERLQPDLMIADITALWAPMVAERCKLPYCHYVPGIFLHSTDRQAMIREAYDGNEPVDWTRMGELREKPWQIERELNRLRRKAGIPATENLSNVADELILSFSPLAIEMNGCGLLPQVSCVGPVFGRPGDVDPFPGAVPDLPSSKRPLVYLSFGNVVAGRREVVQLLIEAVATLPVRVLVAPHRVPELTPPPHASAEFVFASQPLSQPELMNAFDLVVTAGGFNTIMESLSHGVPVLALPQFQEQRVVAKRIEELGLGYCAADDVTASELATQIASAVDDRTLAENVANYAAEQRLTSPIDTSVRLLETLNRDGKIDRGAGAMLALLPDQPLFAARFGLFAENGQLLFKSYSETVPILDEEAKVAVQWLWGRRERRESMSELHAAWDGEADLDIVVSILVQRGVVQSDNGAHRLTSSQAEIYRQQVNVFSHVNAGQEVTHTSQRGEHLQERLLRSRVLVIGEGVFAANTVRHLVSAGFGAIDLVAASDARVTADAISRGAWYQPAQVGRPVSEALFDNAAALREDICFSARTTRLDELHPGDLRGINLVILAQDRFSAEAHRLVNERCYEARVPWTGIRQVGWTVELGPTVIPGNTACFRCLELRRKGGLPEQNTIDGTMVDLNTGWFHVPIGPEWIAMEALKLVTNFGEIPTVGRLVVLNLPSLEINKHRVLRIPNCPVCGGVVERPATTPWFPEHPENIQ